VVKVKSSHFELLHRLFVLVDRFQHAQIIEENLVIGHSHKLKYLIMFIKSYDYTRYINIIIVNGPTRKFVIFPGFVTIDHSSSVSEPIFDRALLSCSFLKFLSTSRTT
jgi:hypothetical protein